jgi:L-fuconolactonase
MLVVDAQVHIWAASTPERPWPARHAAHRPTPFSKDDLLLEMDRAGVHRVVIVPPSWEGERNDLGLEAARLHPDRFAVMGRLDINAPGAREKVASWRQQPGMLGMRFTLGIVEVPADTWLWQEAESAGVPVMMSVKSVDQLATVSTIAQRHPALKIVVDHLALPKGLKDEAAFAGLDKVIALSKYPNIAVKATSLPMFTSDSYPYRRLHPYIRRVYDAFGPKRMFWGTDLTKLPCTYSQAKTMFSEEIPWLTAEDKEWIMGRGVCAWIGWKLPVTA